MWEIEKIETVLHAEGKLPQHITNYRIINKDGILRIDKVFETYEEAKEKCDYLNDYGHIN